jgi:hypothetical protein
MENYSQSKSQTRSTSIDTQLAQAGWSNIEGRGSKATFDYPHPSPLPGGEGV